MSKVKKLTPALLKKMVLREKHRIQEVLETGEEDTEKAAKKTEEVDADELADSLANDVDYLKVLKIKETRLRKKLNKATYNIILRGRHPNRKELFKQIGKKWSTYDHNEVPIKHAKTIGVYLREKKHGRHSFSKNIRK